MLTFLSTSQKPISADVNVNIQDIRSYSRKEEVCREDAASLSPESEDKNTSSMTKSETLSIEPIFFQYRSTMGRSRFRSIKQEDNEWTLHSCKPGPDNSWRTFLREAGHENLPIIQKPRSTISGIEAAKEEYAAEKLQLLPAFDKRVAKEAAQEEDEVDFGKSIPSDELMTSQECLVNVTPVAETPPDYGEWIMNFNPPVESKSLEAFNIVTTVYFGDWSELNMHGYGSYVMALGSRYTGELKEGMYHGKGILYYPRGSRIEGEWIRGVLDAKTRKYFFHDGLEYKETDWGYLRGQDHRFYTEMLHGLLPGCEYKVSNSGVQHCIPIGWYDVCEGYFNPRFKAVMSYDTEELLLGDGSTKHIHKLMRITDRKEMDWIIKHCRGQEDKVIGFQPDLFKFCYEEEETKTETQVGDEESLELPDEVEAEEPVAAEESITKESQILPGAQILKSKMKASPETRHEQEVAESVQILVPNTVIRSALVSEDAAKLLKPYTKDYSLLITSGEGELSLISF